MLVKTSELTPGEKLIIDRRRQGLTQAQMADHLEVSLYQYREVEEDQRSLHGVRVALGALQKPEQCFIARRRAGLTLAAASDQIGVSRWWLRRMERGDAPITRLWNFWAKN